ncbi:glycosyltransferase family 4 protein [Halopiger xanaduensis]|uniref:Glycosyl transferase group 1 n=1 Tax=Halopiger xanaduensis (strain DSM 18323 / JCM 14033 / SH-6) TaxID=797210 RepID=F8DA54_HALXS|nr:glycosyltransferase [Halopiger xanaduensis]AEH36980.1 glycosyl transferase group 1 [Halopiger xanaduensis SH-6]
MSGDATDSEAEGESTYPDVCVVTHPLGGAGENATRTLLEILSAITTISLVTAGLPEGSTIREDHEVVELTTANTGESIPVAAARFLLNQFRMCRLLARRDEEVVLFYGAIAYFLPICCAKLAGKTVVLEPRGNVPLTLRLHWEQRVPGPIARGLAGLVWGLERLGYWLSDAIVTYTPSMASSLGLERFEDKLYTNGARYVDTERFTPRGPFRERDHVVGFLGRLDEEKGIRTLAEVAKRLPDDVTFRFIGDGALRGWLESELSDEIAASTVEVTGWIDHDEVPDQLTELQLLVMPSAPTEGLPTTILEAMACGTPVYATPVVGVPDVVKDGETGYLMEDTSDEAIARKIQRIQTSDDLRSMSHRCRTLVEEEYSFEGAVERFAGILDAISQRGMVSGMEKRNTDGTDAVN